MGAHGGSWRRSGSAGFSCGTLAPALSGEIDLATAYVAYLTVAWNRLYHLYDSPSEAFRAPYDATLAELFDGNHTGEQVLPGVPETPRELFTPQFFQRLQQPAGALREAVRAVDGTCDWRPQVAVHLYAASGDRDVPIANTAYCQRMLQAQGADVHMVDVGDVDHVDVRDPECAAGADAVRRAWSRALME